MIERDALLQPLYSECKHPMPAKHKSEVWVWPLGSKFAMSGLCLKVQAPAHIPGGICDQIRSVAQSCPTLCDPMNCSTPGLPVHHQLLEFTETHVYRVSDAIQPSHPLSSPSPPAPNPSQHQGLFQCCMLITIQILLLSVASLGTQKQVSWLSWSFTFLGVFCIYFRASISRELVK